MFRHDLYLTPMFSGLYKKICLKESEVWRKVISNKIIVTLVTQRLPVRPVAEHWWSILTQKSMLSQRIKDGGRSGVFAVLGGS